MHFDVDMTVWIACSAGFLSFFSPCVLPLVPSYITYITELSNGQIPMVPSRGLNQFTMGCIIMRIMALAIFVLILVQSPALASGTVRYAPLTPELIASGIKIVDIRTEKEWRETGVVKGSLGLTFFREDMTYDVNAFLARLKQYVSPNDKIAIICRTGNRSDKVSRYLAKLGFASVINIDGGVIRAKEAGIKLVPYQQDNSFLTKVQR